MDLTTTFFISQMAGVLCTGLGIVMMTHASALQRYLKGLGKGTQSAVLVGICMVLCSGAVLLWHRDFQTEPGKIITLLALAAFIEGVFFLASPHQLIRRYTKTFKRKKFYYGLACAYLALGLYFMYIGFFVGG